MTQVDEIKLQENKSPDTSVAVHIVSVLFISQSVIKTIRCILFCRCCLEPVAMTTKDPPQLKLTTGEDVRIYIIHYIYNEWYGYCELQYISAYGAANAHTYVFSSLFIG